MKRRKDRENERFLFAKRREEELDGTTKNRSDGERGGGVVQIHCCISQDEFFCCKFLLCLKLSVPSNRV